MPWRFGGGDQSVLQYYVGSDEADMRAIIQRELHITTTEYV